jgi:hypothetical protein
MVVVLNDEACADALAALDALVAERDSIQWAHDQLVPYVDRAEAAEAERDRLKAALERIANGPGETRLPLVRASQIARAALEGTE